MYTDPAQQSLASMLTLITANFTHFNAVHMIMNLSGLVLFTNMFNPRASELALVLTASTIVIAIGVYVTQLTHFMGLSAVLHATVTYFAIKYISMKQKEYWIILFGVLVKVAHEAVFGVTSQSKWLMGGEVQTQAHLIAVFAVLLAVAATQVIKVIDRPASLKRA
ncbi:rhombosortase [Salinivibrio costicola]|uniref:rhombosortase n=1 Tax=Salinivibrio costicola TaxID=51367 RepID=UPI0009E0762A|nr:rhombosortase [Salinivibrio costicola]